MHFQSVPMMELMEIQLALTRMMLLFGVQVMSHNVRRYYY